jgi:hypothetical protein
MDFKERVRKSVEKYLDKQGPSNKPSRKNGKPEKEVEAEVLEWCRGFGWDLNVIESKSVWSEKAGRYIAQSVSPGFSDLAGNTDVGLSVYIELKAPGKLSTIRPDQREFLLRKINSGCFAVCVDSTSRLETIWAGFCKAYNKKEYLVSVLPKYRTVEKELLFDP